MVEEGNPWEITQNPVQSYRILENPIKSYGSLRIPTDSRIPTASYGILRHATESHEILRILQNPVEEVGKARVQSSDVLFGDCEHPNRNVRRPKWTTDLWVPIRFP